MVKKTGIAALLVLGINSGAYSFTFNPTMALLRSNTITKNDVTIQSGTFDLRNRKVNFGFEFTNKFYVNDIYFIKTGLRYNAFKTTVTAADPAAAALGTQVNTYWVSKYTGLAVPIHFGKDFMVGNNHKGDFYAGGSVGIFTPSSMQFGVSTGTSANTPATDTITTSATGSLNLPPASLLTTADFGINYQPIKSAPRLSIGVECSIQLTKTNPTSYNATMNDTYGNTFVYNMQHKQQFVNCALSFSYTFGKQKPSTKEGAMLPTD